MRIEVRHSGDETALAVARLVQRDLPGSVLAQSDPVDDGESNCLVLVYREGSEPRMVASVMWLRNQQRNHQWIEMMASRLAQTLADQGFGGNAVCTVERLHWDHGLDPKDRRKRTMGRAAKRTDVNVSEGFDSSSFGEPPVADAEEDK